ncbi:MAG: nucleotidyltransferase domain-containing protein, partial [Saprospiraceae bacterium]
MNRFGLSETNIALINAIFKDFPKVEKVILYGSRAKGNYRNGSDIDLTIIDQDLNYTEFVKIDFLLDDLLLPYKRLRLILWGEAYLCTKKDK